jgi:hypothetical protein
MPNPTWEQGRAALEISEGAGGQLVAVGPPAHAGAPILVTVYGPGVALDADGELPTPAPIDAQWRIDADGTAHDARPGRPVVTA